MKNILRSRLYSSILSLSLLAGLVLCYFFFSNSGLNLLECNCENCHYEACLSNEIASPSSITDKLILKDEILKDNSFLESTIIRSGPIKRALIIR